MTQQTINLYDGLEALYYMDPTYFDGTAGEIKDKSGHGRHAQASGGPTIGVEGPDSFEATRFDGSDDKFIREEDAQTPITVLTIVKPSSEMTDGGKYQIIGDVNFNTVIGINGQSWNWFNGNPGASMGTVEDITPNEWYTVIWRATSSTRTDVFVNSVQKRARTYSSEIFPKLTNIGEGTHTYFKGDMAVIGIWHRAISKAEIEYLNRLTAPRRAQL